MVRPHLARLAATVTGGVSLVLLAGGYATMASPAAAHAVRADDLRRDRGTAGVPRPAGAPGHRDLLGFLAGAAGNMGDPLPVTSGNQTACLPLRPSPPNTGTAHSNRVVRVRRTGCSG